MNKRIIAYDKRIGVPKFKDWQKREYAAFKKSGLTEREYFKQ